MQCNAATPALCGSRWSLAFFNANATEHRRCLFDRDQTVWRRERDTEGRVAQKAILVQTGYLGTYLGSDQPLVNRAGSSRKQNTRQVNNQKEDSSAGVRGRWETKRYEY